MRNFRRTVVLLALAAASLTAPSSANAAPSEAPADQACAYNAFRQADMSGVFVSAQHQMRLEVFPCGGSTLVWTNDYGTHAASYGSTIRLEGGGVGAMALASSYEKLDTCTTIGIKPAEPGWVQVITVSPYAEIMGVYRLRKI